MHERSTVNCQLSIVNWRAGGGFLSVKFTELQCKEVICVSTGQRLGFVGDVQVELPEGKVRAIVVPCESKMLNLSHKREEYIIPWNCIQKIGPDIVLVDAKPDECRCGRGVKGRLG